MTLRRSTIYRLCAAWLLALAISPFTAPFSTCDVTQLAGAGPAYEGASVKIKLAADALSVHIAGASIMLVPPDRHGPTPVDFSDRDDRRRSLQAVLRL